MGWAILRWVTCLFSGWHCVGPGGTSRATEKVSVTNHTGDTAQDAIGMEPGGSPVGQHYAMGGLLPRIFLISEGSGVDSTMQLQRWACSTQTSTCPLPISQSTALLIPTQFISNNQKQILSDMERLSSWAGQVRQFGR